ncbi:hypothetical protein [Microcystis phage Me-ZS1]|nr:hypothetical protein [Microcystis phage Me-ZS1]
MSNIAKLANLLQSINAKTGTGLNLSIDFVGGGNEFHVEVTKASRADAAFNMVTLYEFDTTAAELEQGLAYAVEEIRATFGI